MVKVSKEELTFIKVVSGFCVYVMLFCCNWTVGQSRIDLTNIRETSDRQLYWNINGVSFSLKDTSVIIYPNNMLDTICFKNKRHSKTWFDTVYTRIPNHEELIMVTDCCDDGFEIYRKDAYEKYSQQFLETPESEQMSLYEQHLEYGTIRDCSKICVMLKK